MNTNNTAFFSTASTGYIAYSITSLLTIRKWLPEAQLYILGTEASDKERLYMLENNITFIELDLRAAFYKAWDYPVECYYIFAGPQKLLSKGFKYSVYLDGDVLCMRSPLLRKKISGVAGVLSPKNKQGKSTDVFGEDWPKIKKKFKLSEEDANKNRINAGIVHFNNERMKKLDLLGKAKQLYRESIEAGIPRKGDDSLFFLLQILFLNNNEKKVLEPVHNYIPQYHDKWEYPLKKPIFFHFSLDKPWKDNPYFHEDKKLDIFNPYVKDWRRQYHSVIGEDLFEENKTLRSRLQLIEGSRSWRLVNVVKKIKPKRVKASLMRRYSESLRLPRQKIKENSKRAIKTWYWLGEDYYGKGRHLYNFGDVCIVDIVKNIFGFNIERAPLDECELIGVGSILQMAQSDANGNKIKVWGSGFIEPGTNNNLENLDFYAVRGKKTEARIDKKVVLGDPGLLASIVYSRASEKHNKIGVLLHYADVNEDIAHKFKMDSRFVLIDPTQPPDKVAYEITRCRAIISSSLHGLIFSDSYKIPNAWLDISKNVYGDGYKFYDYFSGVKINKQKVEVDKIFDEKYQKELINNYQKIYKLRSIQKRLIKAFPSFN